MAKRDGSIRRGDMDMETGRHEEEGTPPCIGEKPRYLYK